MGCRDRAFLDCARFTMGCLGEEPHVREGRDHSGLGGGLKGLIMH